MNVEFSAHAVARYIERVRPTLTARQARDELHRLAELAPVTGPPAWAAGRLANAPVWLELSDGIACPLKPTGRTHTALTVLTRATFSEQTRARRNERNASRRYGKARRREHGPARAA